MSPTRRAAALLAATALLALFVPFPVALLAVGAIAVATVVDGLQVRRPIAVEREVAAVLSRGVRASFSITPTVLADGGLRVRQPLPPALLLDIDETDGSLRSEIVGRRRGRHALPAPVVRRTGPLGLARWDFTVGASGEVSVFPDLVAARRVVESFSRSAFGSAGQRPRGPLGLGTEFESIRDYSPDDDFRQVNWRATARTGRPMSNQYRVEQDREVVCLVDCGRLMAAPLRDRTRLDAALDAVACVALAADAGGDRCGVLAFDAEVRRHVRPQRRGADAVVRACFDLEPRPVDSDYELSFRSITGAKRALVLVFTDLLDPSAASALLDAMPVLTRRHAVAVASARDLDVAARIAAAPRTVFDVYAAAVALDVLAARTRVATALRRAGASVVEAGPTQLGRACVEAYLSLKGRARL